MPQTILQYLVSNNKNVVIWLMQDSQLLTDDHTYAERTARCQII
jgi:hypothetical protein